MARENNAISISKALLAESTIAIRIWLRTGCMMCQAEGDTGDFTDDTVDLSLVGISDMRHLFMTARMHARESRMMSAKNRVSK